MRVLVLATDAFGGTGGIAQYTRDVVRAIASDPGIENVTVIPRVITREPEPLPPRVTHLSHAAGKKSRFAVTVLRAAAHRPRYDWIVCGHVNLLPVAHFVAAIAGAKVILLTFGIEVWEPRGWITRTLIRRTESILSISSFTLERLRTWISLPRDHFTLLPNAIDLSAYTPGPKNETLLCRLSLGGRRVLLTVGRIDAAEQAKGFDEVLDVLPGLLADLPDIAYVVVGDGSDRPRLEAKARALGLANHVIFAGYVPESDKLDYYRLADVFVMPSRLEGFGYVFLEALAVGIPVIASKVDGSREAVNNGKWGVLVDPSSADELSAAIRSALTNPILPDRSELDIFSWNSFERRCHAALDALRRGRLPAQRDFTD